MSYLKAEAWIAMATSRQTPNFWSAGRPIVISPSGGVFDYAGIGKSFILASVSPDSKRSGPSIEPKLAMKKIMIVDDEAQIAKLYSLILSNMGFTVSNLEFDGVAAVDRISKDRDIDLLIIDQRMPKLDGTTATKKIKEIKPEIRVVMVTAYEITESDRYLFDAILTKPISSKSLADTVTAILSK
jgi:CheY-like chemotaxis protein